MEETHAARLLQKYFPYSVLSKVPLFRADTLDTHLYAHQLDFLIHLQKGDQQRLIIIECKNNPLKRFHKPSAKPIDEKSARWFAHYFGKSKDAKKQVRSQAGALFQILDLQRRKGPSVEGWIVHSGKQQSEIFDSSDPGFTLTAMTEELFIKRLDHIVGEGWRAHTLLSSEYLWELHHSSAERIGHARREGKSEFKSVRDSPLDELACSASQLILKDGVYDVRKASTGLRTGGIERK